MAAPSNQVSRWNLVARLTPSERRLFFRVVSVGAIITVLVLFADVFGLLDGPERWMYDRRAATCQFFNTAPSKQVVHLDIDDKAIDAIGRWPWPRSKMAEILEEVALAKPRAVGIDVLYSEGEYVQQPDGTLTRSPGDAALATALKHVGNVIIPVSLEIAPPRSVSTVEAAALAELTANLELTPDQLLNRLRTRGFPAESVAARYNEQYLEYRRQATYDRVRSELEQKHDVSLRELYSMLLPHAEEQQNTPVQRLIESEYERVRAVNAMARFGINQAALKRMPVPTVTKLVPLPELSEQAGGCGFVDFEIFSEATVRSMPLLLRENDVIYPQFGVAVACQMLGADLHKLRIDGGNVHVPRKGAPDVVIPTRTYSSSRLRRDVSLMMDIPFFGTDRWETIYDWPAHESSVQHLSLGAIWDICLARSKISHNNANVDKAVDVTLSENGLGFDPALAKRYAANRPPLSDSAGRKQIIATMQKELSDSGWLKVYDSMDEATMSAEEKEQRDNLRDADRALRIASEQNDKLEQQISVGRKEISNSVHGNAVMIGWTATGAADVVTTSIQPRCPGVVVHGVIANAVLTGNWWRPAPAWVEASFTVAIGLLTAVAVGYFSPAIASLITVGLLLGYFAINGIVIFDWGNHVVGLAGPTVSLAAVWAGAAIMRLTHETLERIRVARDLAVFKHEMELARNVQQALIPKRPPEIAGLEPHGWTKPADLTGGDCFDLWELPDGRLGIFLADASGHGLAPSMVVSQARALVRAIAEIEKHPDTVLSRVNARMAADLEPGRFATAFLGFLSNDGTLEWAAAGHGPQIWCDVCTGEMKEFDSTALPLGVMSDWAGDVVPPLQLQPTGMVIIFSDGIFEAPDPKGELFGVERLQAIINEHREKSPAEIIAAIRERVTAWQGRDNPHDDQTTVIVRRSSVAAVTNTETGKSATVTVELGANEPA